MERIVRFGFAFEDSKQRRSIIDTNVNVAIIVETFFERFECEFNSISFQNVDVVLRILENFLVPFFTNDCNYTRRRYKISTPAEVGGIYKKNVVFILDITFVDVQILEEDLIQELRRFVQVAGS